MSQDFSSSVIQRDIDAKRAKLEALKAKRLARLAAQQADGATDDAPLSPSSAAAAGARSPETSFAIELDRSSASLGNSDVGSLGPSLNASLNDSMLSHASGVAAPAASASLADALLSPSSTLSPSYSRTFVSKSRLSSSEQLQAIKHSFDEIAQHSTESATAMRPRASFGPMDAVSPVKSASPPVAAASIASELNDSTLAAGADSLNVSLTSSPASPGHAAHSMIPNITGANADPAAQAAMIDDLLAQIQTLSESIRSKNEDLAMAGDLGSVLLQNNEEANARIAEQAAALDRLAAELYAAKDEIRAGERKARKLAAHLTETQHLQQEAESEAEISRMELELERQRVRQAEIDLLKLQADSSSSDALAEVNAELAEAKAAQAKLESQLTDMRRARETAEQRAQQLAEENTDLKADLAEAEKAGDRVRELTEQVAILKANDTVHVLAELQFENARLVEAMQELVQQYQVLQESNARDQELLRGLQSHHEAYEREQQASRLDQHHARAPKPFESLADDAVVDEAPPADASKQQAHPQVDSPEKVVEIATAAAAMHLGSLPVKSVARSSLASGSASLAYPADPTGTTPIKPIMPHHTTPPTMHVSTHSAASVSGPTSGLSPLSAASLGSSAAMHAPSSKAGMFGFIQSLLPGNASAAAVTARRLNFSRTDDHPLTGGGGMKVDPNMKLVQYPAQPIVSSPSSRVWDENELEKQEERTSSHASSITGRKPGERDADFEFFALTLLCVKIHAARRMESLYTVSTQDLWLRAKKEDVQFHQYYQWLEEQITKTYVSKLVSAKQNSGQYTEAVLDSYLPSNSATPARSLNTAAARMALQTPVANSPNLPASSAAGAAGAAAAIRVLSGTPRALSFSVGLEPMRSPTAKDDVFEDISLETNGKSNA